MDGVSRTLSYGYDKTGNRIRITHPDGTFFTMCYDPRDRLDRAWWTEAGGGFVACGGGQQFLDIDYTHVGLRSRVNRASSYTDYGYDAALRFQALTQRFNGNLDNVTQNFAYNPAGQITTRTTSNNSYVWTGHYNVSRNYAVNGLNQYSSAGGATFAHDPNGNLTSDGSTGFLYDVENRLVSANGAKSATLRYDPMGRLYEVSGPSGIIRFLHDGDHIVGEYASNGIQLRRYFWGPGADEPILWAEGSTMSCTNAKFLHPDHQGSIIATADCWGGIRNINRYDEYGIPAIANAGRFQYTGQAWLPELGMSYYKARMYSPTLGRFMQTDPIGYSDNINLYGYVANDPVNGSDPTGKQSVQDQQLQMQIDDMRQQGMSERQIHQEIGRQAGIEATALSIPAPVEGLAVRGLGLLGRALGIGEKGATVAKAEGVVGKVAADTVAQGPRFARGELRQQVLDKGRQADGSISCAYCGKPTATTSDHVVPYSKGGPTNVGNLEPACVSCNASKGAKDLGTEWVPPILRNWIP